MKTKIFKNLFLSALVITFFTDCANDDDYNAPNSICQDQTQGLVANVNGADLYAIATATVTEYSPNGNDYLEAYITSSDRGGNFFKTISLETADNRGMSISLDLPNTYTKGYQVGRKVFIKLNGLFYNINHSSLILGDFFINAAGNEIVGRIPENKIANHIFFSCDFKPEEELIYDVSVAQAKNNNYINKLLRLSDVEFVEAGQTYYDKDNVIGGSTNRTIRDYFGSTLIFRTGSFAIYSGMTIPKKSGKVVGVMTKFNSDFQFVSRDERDLKLTEDPLGDLQAITPGANAVGVFTGHDFEDWNDFIGGLTSQGIKSYATQGIGTGMEGSNSLHIQTSGTSNNELVFIARAHANLPANPSRIIFWMKGTSAKSLSVSMYRADNPAQWVVFNIGSVTATKGITSSSANSYVGTINTGGEWVQIILDLGSAGVVLNTTDFNENFFGIRVGNNANYDLHFDNFLIE